MTFTRSMVLKADRCLCRVNAGCNLGLEGRAADEPVLPCVAPGTSASTSNELGLSQHQTTHGEDHLVQHMQILSAHEIAVNHIAVSPRSALGSGA
jgi:hypothetical protein